MRQSLIATALSAFAAFAASASVVPPTEQPYLLQFVDDVADAAGLQSLPEVPMLPGASEVRIWTGFGVASPEHLVILKIHADGTRTGRALSYVRIPEDDDDTTFQRWRKECVSTSTRKGIVICDPRAAHQMDWSIVVEEAHRLGVASLRDESQLPGTRSRIKDGMSMVVEVREADAYRAYAYANPHLRSEPQAQAAADIMRLVGRAFEDR